MLGTSCLKVRLMQSISVKAWNNTQQTYQPLPWIFVQEPHRNIEGRAPPALETVRICQSVASFLCNVDHVDSPQASSQERLVSISPSSVHDENPRVFSHRFSERFGAGLNDNISPTDFARDRCVQRWTRFFFSVLELGNDNLILQAGLSLEKEIKRCRHCRVGKLTVCPLIELPLTATSPKYANSFCARFCV